MQASAWINLLRRIPSDQYDCLTLMTTNGTEIVLQRLIRLERDCVVAMGRMAGSTEQGKVLVLPYDQLTYLAFNKKLTDEEIESMLGKAEPTAATSTPAAVSVEGEGVGKGQTPQAPNRFSTPIWEEPELGSQPPPVAASAKSNAEASRASSGADEATLKQGTKASPPSKSILLARLRQRLSEDISKQAK